MKNCVNRLKFHWVKAIYKAVFLSLLNINLFKKIRRYVLKEALNKTMYKLSTAPKICAGTTLWNMKWQIEPSAQYLHYILMNHWRATFAISMTDSNSLKNRQPCSKLHHLYNTCSKRPPPARTKSQMSMNWDDTSKTSEQSESCCSLNVRLVTCGQRVHVIAFVLVADISSTWCKNNVTCYTFDDFRQ